MWDEMGGVGGGGHNGKQQQQYYKALQESGSFQMVINIFTNQ